MNCSFSSEDSVCGPFRANSTILPLVKCEEDMTSHLISLGVSSKRGRRSIPTLSESNLILNRAGRSFRTWFTKDWENDNLSETEARTYSRLGGTKK